MRHIIIGILLLSIVGCSKSEKSKCYECKEVVDKKKGLVLIGSSNITITHCDKSESEIKAIEKENTYVTTENGITTEATCNCNLK